MSRKKLLDRLGKEWLFCDGGTGTLLQARGLQAGELPETWNLTHPDDIVDLYRGYLDAGCNIFNTNTFGANRLKFPDNLEEIVIASVNLAKKARALSGREDDAYIAMDIGPTGKLLEPLGDLSFDHAVEIFGELVRIGAAAGADLILIETMNDTYEAKAAVLAAKENCDLPVCITTTYDENGQLLTGAPVEAVISMLEGLRVDAVGVNCSLGPGQMLPIVQRIVDCASVPVIVNPNAGLPHTENGKTVYDMDADTFAGYMSQIADLGVSVCGGCCGTTPEFIRKTIAAVSKKPFHRHAPCEKTYVTSFSQAVEIGPKPVIIGERINPTGKKKFKEALKSHDIAYILQQGLSQEDAGAHILDVNVGLPDIDEAAMMKEVVCRLQGVTGLPLQIDTTNMDAMEQALRYYNGKPMVNSTNGKEEVMDQVMPLVAKYGGVLVSLVIDEDGIPATANKRIAIARKIYAKAQQYGIPRKDIVIDGLAMTISSDPGGAVQTLETLRRVRDELHGHSILGVSNISFGLPARELINSNFLTMAMVSGLSCAIINPQNEAMMQAYRASLALLNLDPNDEEFIRAYADYVPVSKRIAAAQAAARAAAGDGTRETGAGAASGTGTGALPSVSGSAPAPGNAGGTAAPSGSGTEGEKGPLYDAVFHGVRESAAAACTEGLQNGSTGMELINSQLIPALDAVGKGFEKKTMFLPQLLMSAEAAKAAFDVIRQSMSGKPQEVKGRIILATVKGDIHDIGKNIVKVMLENYGYDVIDLGKDVDPEVIVDTAIRENIHLVGLSALMTTTVVNMEATIRLLHEKWPDCKIMVGGAVMTQEYADKIGADFYGKDAMASVRYADSIFGTTAN